MNDQYLIDYTPTFAKHFRKLPVSVKNKALKKELILKSMPFSQILKTHKLSGQLSQYWSFSIDYHYRIVFRFINAKHLLLVDVGTHEIYK